MSTKEKIPGTLIAIAIFLVGVCAFVVSADTHVPSTTKMNTVVGNVSNRLSHVSSISVGGAFTGWSTTTRVIITNNYTGVSGAVPAIQGTTSKGNSPGISGKGLNIGIQGYGTGAGGSRGVYGYSLTGYGVLGQGGLYGGYFTGGGGLYGSTVVSGDGKFNGSSPFGGGTWRTATCYLPYSSASISPVTVRERLYCPLHGNALKARFTAGSSPLTVVNAYLGLDNGSGAITGTNYPLTFNNGLLSSVTIPAYSTVESDPLSAADPYGQYWDVTAYCTGGYSCIEDKSATPYYETGNVASVTRALANQSSDNMTSHNVTGLMVRALAADNPQTYTLFGTSITGGGQGMPNSFKYLLSANSNVYCAAKNGNSSVQETTSAYIPYRLQNGQGGNIAIVDLMTNDIIGGVSETTLKSNLTKTFAFLAEHGYTVVGTTCIPNWFTGAQETERQNMNAWMRSKPQYVSGVLDWDAALYDPAHTNQMMSNYTSGSDHTHPNAAGHAAMFAAWNKLSTPQYPFVTPGTSTKVTYDDQGRVTVGASATTADINDSTDKRYCTDAQKTVIGNTSGTNTGDQDLTSYAKMLTSNLTLYADSVNGSDTAGHGFSSGSGACASIGYALNLANSLIPPVQNGFTVTINFTGTFRETPVCNFPVILNGVLTTVLGDTAVSTAADRSGATPAYLAVAGTPWAVNAYQNKLLYISSGTGAGQYRWILSSTANDINVEAWATKPDNTSHFLVYDVPRITGANAGADTTAVRSDGVDINSPGVTITNARIDYVTLRALYIKGATRVMLNNVDLSHSLSVGLWPTDAEVTANTIFVHDCAIRGILNSQSELAINDGYILNVPIGHISFDGGDTSFQRSRIDGCITYGLEASYIGRVNLQPGTLSCSIVNCGTGVYQDHNGMIQNPGSQNYSGNTLDQLLSTIGMVALAPASTITLDPTTGNVFSLTLNNYNPTINMASGVACPQGTTIKFVIYGTGTLTATFGTGFKPTATVTPSNGSHITVTFTFDGTNWNEDSRSKDASN